VRDFIPFSLPMIPQLSPPPPPHIFSVGIFFTFPQMKQLVMHEGEFGIHLVFSGDYCGGPSVNPAAMVQLPQIPPLSE